MMTTEEKAKAYDEAIERARKKYNSKYHPSEGPSGVYLNNADLEEIFPELVESEDERIRKALLKMISDIDGGWPFEKYGLIKREARDYLEKKKETLKSSDSILSNAKCEGRWHKVSDSFPDSTREVICKDAIGNFFIGRYYKKINSWDVSMYDDVNKLNDDNPPVVMWCDIPSEKQKKQDEKPSKPELKTPEWVCGDWDDEYMINTVIGRYSLHAEVAKKQGDTHDYNLSKSMENWLRKVVKPLLLEKQKEQKSMDIAPNQFDGITYGMQGYSTEKPVEWSEEDIKKIRSEEYTKGFNDAAFGGKLKEWSEDIIQKAVKEVGLTQHQIDWFKDNVFPPKQEWSEEDKHILKNIHDFIEENIIDPNRVNCAKECLNWLNSLSLKGSIFNQKTKMEQGRS